MVQSRTTTLDLTGLAMPDASFARATIEMRADEPVFSVPADAQRGGEASPLIAAFSLSLVYGLWMFTRLMVRHER